MASQHLDKVIDDICGQGCSYVKEILSGDKSVIDCREMRALHSNDKDFVVSELRQIMSVYDGEKTCCSPQ